MRWIAILGWAVGVLLFVGLLVWSGAGAVGAAVASVGWGIGAVVAVRALAVSGAGTGWWFVFPPRAAPRLSVCVLIRFVREGVNTLMPLTQVGGDVIGARLLSFRIEGALAAASVIVDVLLQAATQFLFAAIGLVVLIALGAGDTIAQLAGLGIAIAALGLGGFYWVQRHGGRRAVEAILRRLVGHRPAFMGAVASLYDGLERLHTNRVGLATATGIHLGVWFLGAVEVWIALRCMGYRVGLAQALVIESLNQAIRGAAFAIPGALGAQEGAMIALCAIFGIPPQSALAVSLIKRVADLTLGVPGLFAWQALEGRRWLRRRAEPRRAE